MSCNNNQPVTTSLRATLIATLQGASPGPTSVDEESLQLNQGTVGTPVPDREACTSNIINPAFDQLTLIKALNNIALQQRDQHRANQELQHLVAKLAEKVDDLNKKKNDEPPEENGEDSNAPSQSDDGGKATSGGKRDEDENHEGEPSDEAEDGQQRFVDHAYYRYMIGEGFA